MTRTILFLFVSVACAADWSAPVLDNRFVLGVQGVYSWNMNQQGIVDVNVTRHSDS